MGTNKELLHNKVTAYKVIVIQVIVTAFIAGLLYMTKSEVFAYSAVLGGFASIGPNSLFVRCAFRHSAANSPSLVMKWFMVGEAGKLLMTALIFALSIKSVEPLEMSAMVITFLIVTIVNMVGLALLNAR